MLNTQHILPVKPLLGLLFSYLLGSVPTAFLFAKARGIDLRKHGSGNLGATNAFRVLGKKTGSTVLLLDVLKGCLAVLLCVYVFFDPSLKVSVPMYACLAALCVVGGHNWTVFLGFKGGKGVATSLGVLIAFSIFIDRFGLLVLFSVCLWLAIFLSSGFVSLASCAASAALPFFGLSLKLPLSINVLLSVLAFSSLLKHKENIKRLLHKKEHRFNTGAFFKKIFSR